MNQGAGVAFTELIKEPQNGTNLVSTPVKDIGRGFQWLSVKFEAFLLQQSLLGSLHL